MNPPEDLSENLDKRIEAMTVAEREQLAEQPTPYDWCRGWPEAGEQGKLRCRLLGYCRRNPSCGD